MRVRLTSLRPASPTLGLVSALSLTLAGVTLTLTMRLVTRGVGAGATAALSWSRPLCLSSSLSLLSFPPSTLFSGQSISWVALYVYIIFIRPRTIQVLSRKCIKYLRENRGGKPSEVSSKENVRPSILKHLLSLLLVSSLYKENTGFCSRI